MNSNAPSSPPARLNRLAQEKSPYLQQHQHNPVDWQPWGPEAFAQARQMDRPIFLSIGYSTCHWCHVMERESFENENLARYLNEHFVSIKVDREERPDVDKIYMTFVQATTGGGGWPLSVFLTPSLKPFFGGTYFPPDNRHGRPGFLQVLQHLHELWETRREDIVASADHIHERLETAVRPAAAGPQPALSAAAVENAATLLKNAYDPRHGGFGGAPKFPQPSQPQLLLRYATRCGDEAALKMVLHTCDSMARGGIHDQLGGGFARYSVDAEWLVPHFEKMLYDNAQLLQLYLDAYLISGEPRHAAVARGIIDYVLRDMTHPEGGFFSAEDADSEGHEGKFYCWTRAELQELLSSSEFKVAVRFYGITEPGNFVDHSHPTPLPGQNVLSIVDSQLSAEEQAHLASARQKMFATRSRRVRPHLDDKVLASWNGLMLGALARAGVVLGDPGYRTAAEKNFAFIRDKLWDEGGTTLYHRWRDGKRDQAQLLSAYAFLLSGVIELYGSTLCPEQLEFAIGLADSMLKKFYEPEIGGFFQSPPDAQDLIVRLKEDYDGAEPSGNSVAILSLLKLGKIAGRKDYLEAAERSLGLFANRLRDIPQAVPFMVQALDFSLHEPKRVVVAGDPSTAESKELLRAIHSVYETNKVVLGNLGPVDVFSRGLETKTRSEVYLCLGSSCQLPTRDPARVREMLRS